VLEAIKSKALSINSFPALVRVATSVSQYIDTDFRLTDIPGLLKEYLRKKDYAIESVALTLENVLDEGRGPQGQYILTPQYDDTKWSIVHEYLQERYAGLTEASSTAKLRKKYAPTPTPQPISPIPSPKSK
jgi:anionic cell wall polymer biosynthesis LytR-Cps2A-Psr (LCP) family protein